MRSKISIIATGLAATALATVTNTTLTVDEYGHVSPTNALVTQAQIAAVAASNQLVLAEMEAAEAGYNAALELLTATAQSMLTTPIVFYGVEVVGFDAAVVFGEDARCAICRFVPTVAVETKDVGGISIECRKWSLGLAFTDRLQGVQPLVAYSTNVNGRAEWDNLNPVLVSSPVLQEGTWTDGSSNTYANVYLMDCWIPVRWTGFVAVRVPNDAVSGDGSTMEHPGAKGGINCELIIGTNHIEYVNGVAYRKED